MASEARIASICRARFGLEDLAAVLEGNLGWHRGHRGEFGGMMLAAGVDARGCQPVREAEMDDETFNMSMRKYLKQVGVTSQQAIERHVREHGDLAGRLKVRTVLTIEGHGMEHVVEGEIDLG